MGASCLQRDSQQDQGGEGRFITRRYAPNVEICDAKPKKEVGDGAKNTYHRMLAHETAPERVKRTEDCPPADTLSLESDIAGSNCICSNASFRRDTIKRGLSAGG